MATYGVGVPPKIGLEAALPTIRLLMAVGHNYYTKVSMIKEVLVLQCVCTNMWINSKFSKKMCLVC
jgi:hypothetical protein